jgi:competence protein ComEC
LVKLLVVLLAVVLALGLTACGLKHQAAPPPVEPPPAAPGPSPVTPPSAPPVPSTPSTSTVSGNLVARFLDVGQGDSCFISLPDGKTMLIDAGTSASGTSIVNYIKALAVARLDYVIFTHPHEDHIGGAKAVLEAFEIGEIYMPRTSHTTQTYENLLLAIHAKGLTIAGAEAGTVLIDRENLKASFIGPVKSYPELNDWSPVLVLKYDTKTFVFAGDASTTAEADMLAAETVPDADVLKVGHHGSSTSTGRAFLRAVTPEVAVISVGEGNSYGHPAQATLDRLSAAGATVYRTDTNGTVIVSTDGKALSVSMERQ